MAELLLELFSEEIPAGMQPTASANLARLVTKGMADSGLAHGDYEAFATPRRLTLVIKDVASGSKAVSEERKGPRVGAPEKAIEGFLRGAGLKTIDEAEVVTDPKKGDFYVAKTEKPGRDAADILAGIVPETVRKFPWPKSMEWGDGGLKWVRPLHSILCQLDGAVVPFEVAGIESGNATGGHRFMGQSDITVKGAVDYAKKLAGNKVILDAETRMKMIREQAEKIAKQAKLEWVEDEALVAENAGLNEWPTVLMGSFDDDFLGVPPEVLTTSMKSHQKCFSLRDPKTGQLVNKFLLVTNLEAKDGGTAIIAGNERVIRARLADAKFFWDKDLATKLEVMREGLGAITFHEKLGTQGERVERITELAREIAGAVDAEPDLAGRAAQLCKADLVSEMVGEFPELQGLIGRYYAEAEKMDPKIATALEQHYWPKGAGGDVPTEPVSIAVALADKLDTLIGFWAINEKPTGSGDPYALRRAALGVIRMCVENDLRLRLTRVLTRPAFEAISELRSKQIAEGRSPIETVRPSMTKPESRDLYYNEVFAEMLRGTGVGTFDEEKKLYQDRFNNCLHDLLTFFADRLKVYLRDRGQRHDLIDAVFSLGGQDDLALIVRRVEALGEFLETDDGTNLLAGVKRAANILTIEEKKDKTSHAGEADAKLLDAAEEKVLHAAIEKVSTDVTKALNVENFGGAMRALAELRAPVDAFFDNVKVNDDNADVRANRLKLLSQIRSATQHVADFSRIGG